MIFKVYQQTKLTVASFKLILRFPPVLLITIQFSNIFFLFVCFITRKNTVRSEKSEHFAFVSPFTNSHCGFELINC